jgi:putative transposase
MPRRARQAVAGIPWHIIQRGNNRQACFYVAADNRRYLQYPGRQAGKFGCLIHAWCLMTNPVHLPVTPERADSAGLLMKHPGQRYVQCINRTWRRSGTLWEGRFRSCLAQKETYLLACYRQIELNPVRAGRVEHPAGYAWSSNRANGQGTNNALLDPHPLYRAPGQTRAARCRHYRELFRLDLDPELIDELRQATNGNDVPGDARFSAEIEAMLRRRVTPGRAGRPVKNQRKSWSVPYFLCSLRPSNRCRNGECRELRGYRETG